MDKICAICGEHFETKQYNKKYCCEACYKVGKQQKRNQRKYERNCTVCKKLFISKSQRALYCSKACYKEYHSKPNVELRKRREETPKAKPTYTIGKKLKDLTFEQGLNYGKISYQRQVEAMRKKRTG